MWSARPGPASSSGEAPGPGAGPSARCGQPPLGRRFPGFRFHVSFTPFTLGGLALLASEARGHRVEIKTDSA